ncbi:MAG: hypothetical protein K0Q79_1497 [Flavipsychrobacter sp.]|jgi:hypothetical protein|nr:hypothetical protein [Flavipsychrobacter sp.]
MAKQMMDIGLITATGGADLKIVAGDFVVVESRAEHNKNLIYCNKGEFNENPSLCVGAINYVDDENPEDLVEAITTALLKDGMNVKSVAVGSSGVIETNAFYI